MLISNSLQLLKKALAKLKQHLGEENVLVDQETGAVSVIFERVHVYPGLPPAPVLVGVNQYEADQHALKEYDQVMQLLVDLENMKEVFK